MNTETIDTKTGAGFSIIIPTYNESDVIVDSIRRTHEIWPAAKLLIIDDGSGDSTMGDVRDLDVSYVTLHGYRANRGKGFAVSRGIDMADTPYTIQLDADCQFPPESMPELVAPLIENRVKVVFCSRYCDGASREHGSVSPGKRLAGFVASGLVSLLALQRLTDVFAGFKAWDTRFMQELGIKESGFGYEAEIAIRASRKGEKIAEIPICYAARTGGESKINYSRDLVGVPLSILRVWLSS